MTTDGAKLAEGLLKFLGDAPDASWMALSDSASDSLIRKAFEKYKLDPKKPSHWRELVQKLTFNQFGEHRGRSKVLKGPKLGQLLLAIAENSRNPKQRSALAIAKRIKDRPGYRDRSDRTLRRMVDVALGFIEGIEIELILIKCRASRRAAPSQKVLKKWARKRAFDRLLNELDKRQTGS